jgi:hypothetical protein
MTDGEAIYSEVEVLKEICNFVVEYYFILNHLVSENSILSFQILIFFRIFQMTLDEETI